MMWDGNGFWDHGASWGAGGWLMGIGMIALIVVAVVLVVYLIRTMSQPQGPATVGQSREYGAQWTAPVTTPPATTAQLGGGESPKDIVKRRYAAGEIDREEYVQKLADL
jgi:uncharacterized membrane protein